jgi:hypothetical protein
MKERAEKEGKTLPKLFLRAFLETGLVPAGYLMQGTGDPQEAEVPWNSP